MTALTVAELDDQLDALLNPVLSSRRTATPLAAGLAAATRPQQDFTLRWVVVIARSNYELAYQFAAAAPAALTILDDDAAQTWVIHALDTYDRVGLYQGTAVCKNFSTFATRADAKAAVDYAEVAPVLALYVSALSGRRMKIDAAALAWTDTETLYLPLRMAAGANRAQNFLIYKMISTLLWAQNRYGTFNADLDAAAQHHADPARALAWLNYLECVRLEAHIARALPGLARDLAPLRGSSIDSATHYARLHLPSATVEDSIALLNTLPLSDEPPRPAWMGVLRPAQAAALRATRLAREKTALQAALAALRDEQSSSNPGAHGRAADATAPFTASINTHADGEHECTLYFGGEPLAPPGPIRHLLESIVQDLGDIPGDYLTAAGTDAIPAHTDEAATLRAEDNALYYNEWDYQCRHYRKNWCVLREQDVPAGDADFVNATLKKYAPQVAHLKRSFEMLRGDDRLLKRMTHGDTIDLDAVIAAYADRQCGYELSERLYTKRRKTERNLAVMFMVDMSGSTKGWINDAAREALVLLSAALEVLGDRYAIYGFSGITRKRCEIFRVKRFDEPYSTLVQQRIAGVAPRNYTRMGVAIRHLSALLDSIDARTKLLITLSDGKPDDYSDNYRGAYGIEDTRQALLEAQRAGIKPFCITIDDQARDYLPHMYGAVNWTLVEDVSRLPLKVAEIYRRLTTG